MRTFKSLSECEILALAISLEEEDARIYDNFAEGLQASYPATAESLKQMRVASLGWTRAGATPFEKYRVDDDCAIYTNRHGQ